MVKGLLLCITSLRFVEMMMKVEDVVIKALIAGESHISAACEVFQTHRGNCFGECTACIYTCTCIAPCHQIVVHGWRVVGASPLRGECTDRSVCVCQTAHAQSLCECSMVDQFFQCAKKQQRKVHAPAGA